MPNGHQKPTLETDPLAGLEDQLLPQGAQPPAPPQAASADPLEGLVDPASDPLAGIEDVGLPAADRIRRAIESASSIEVPFEARHPWLNALVVEPVKQVSAFIVHGLRSGAAGRMPSQFGQAQAVQETQRYMQSLSPEELERAQGGFALVASMAVPMAGVQLARTLFSGPGQLAPRVASILAAEFAGGATYGAIAPTAPGMTRGEQIGLYGASGVVLGGAARGVAKAWRWAAAKLGARGAARARELLANLDEELRIRAGVQDGLAGLPPDAQNEALARVYEQTARELDPNIAPLDVLMREEAAKPVVGRSDLPDPDGAFQFSQPFRAPKALRPKRPAGFEPTAAAKQRLPRPAAPEGFFPGVGPAERGRRFSFVFRITDRLPSGAELTEMGQADIAQFGEGTKTVRVSVLDESGEQKGFLVGSLLEDGTRLNFSIDSGNLGVSGLRQLATALRERFPVLRTVSGTRISGARQLAGLGGEHVTFELPAGERRLPLSASAEPPEGFIAGAAPIRHVPAAIITESQAIGARVLDDVFDPSRLTPEGRPDVIAKAGTKIDEQIIERFRDAGLSHPIETDRGLLRVRTRGVAPDDLAGLTKLEFDRTTETARLGRVTPEEAVEAANRLTERGEASTRAAFAERFAQLRREQGLGEPLTITAPEGLEYTAAQIVAGDAAPEVKMIELVALGAEDAVSRISPLEVAAQNVRETAAGVTEDAVLEQLAMRLGMTAGGRNPYKTGSPLWRAFQRGAAQLAAGRVVPLANAELVAQARDIERLAIARALASEDPAAPRRLARLLGLEAEPHTQIRASWLEDADDKALRGPEAEGAEVAARMTPEQLEALQREFMRIANAPLPPSTLEVVKDEMQKIAAAEAEFAREWAVRQHKLGEAGAAAARFVLGTAGAGLGGLAGVESGDSPTERTVLGTIGAIGGALLLSRWSRLGNRGIVKLIRDFEAFKQEVLAGRAPKPMPHQVDAESLIFLNERDDLLPAPGGRWTATLQDGSQFPGATARDAIGLAAEARFRGRYGPETGESLSSTRSMISQMLETWEKYGALPDWMEVGFENRFGQFITDSQFKTEIAALRGAYEAKWRQSLGLGERGAAKPEILARIAGGATAAGVYWLASRWDDDEHPAWLKNGLQWIGALAAGVAVWPAGKAAFKKIPWVKMVAPQVFMNAAEKVPFRAYSDAATFAREWSHSINRLMAKTLRPGSHRAFLVAVDEMDPVRGIFPPEFYTLTQEEQQAALMIHTQDAQVGQTLRAAGMQRVYVEDRVRAVLPQTTYDRWRTHGWVTALDGTRQRIWKHAELEAFARAHGLPGPREDAPLVVSSRIQSMWTAYTGLRLRKELERLAIVTDNNPAVPLPAGWREIRGGPSNGKIAPDAVATALENVSRPAANRQDWVRALDTLKGFWMRSVMFWFWEHGLNGLRAASVASWSPGAYKQAIRMLGDNDPALFEWVRRGLDLRHRPDYPVDIPVAWENFLKKLDGMPVIGQIKRLGGRAIEWQDRMLWDRIIPAAQLTVVLTEMLKFTKRTGGRFVRGTPEYEAAARKAVDFANVALGRFPTALADPRLLQAARLLMFSPQWTGTRLALIGGAVGEASDILAGRLAIGDAVYLPLKMRQLALTVGLTWTLSKVLSGKEPEFNPRTHKFYARTGLINEAGREVGFDLAGWWQDDLKLTGQFPPLDYFRDRLNPMLKVAGETVTGRDFTGRDMTIPQRFLNLARSLGPPTDLAEYALREARGDVTGAERLQRLTNVAAVANVAALPRPFDVGIAHMAKNLLRSTGLPQNEYLVFELSRLLRGNFLAGTPLIDGQVMTYLAYRRRSQETHEPITETFDWLSEHINRTISSW